MLGLELAPGKIKERVLGLLDSERVEIEAIQTAERESARRRDGLESWGEEQRLARAASLMARNPSALRLLSHFMTADHYRSHLSTSI